VITKVAETTVPINEGKTRAEEASLIICSRAPHQVVERLITRDDIYFSP